MTIRKRKGGNWFYRFSYAGEDYSVGGFKSAAAAERAEEEAKKLLVSPNTVARLVRRRKEYVKAYCSHKHQLDTNTLLRPLIMRWGHLPVEMITQKMIQDAVLDLRNQISNNNVNKHLRAWKTLFQMAVDEGMISRNPVRGVKMLPHSRKPKKVPTQGEIKEVLLRALPEQRAYLTVIWGTAARVSEVNRLAWEHVDFDKNTLKLSTRKSKGGDLVWREIPMLPLVRKAMEYMWKHRVKGSPWVFTNRDMVNKHPGDPEKWRYQYRGKFLRNLSDGKFSYHDLRHATASALASLNVEIPVIQKVLGHQRPTTTDLYLQSLPSGVVEGMDKLGELYEG